MLVFALLVIVVCIGVIHKVHSVTAEPPMDERIADWQWPNRDWASSKTEDPS